VRNLRSRAQLVGPAHTFLFTDLVGFTALTAAHGDDRAAEVAIELHDRVRPLAAAHDGEVVKHIGDGLMLRCSDPAMGIRLGLAIVNELEGVAGFPAVRVGLHTGSAVERNGDWYGGTVNVAARLCAAAGGGEVLASDETCGAVARDRHVALSEPRLHWLKNVTEPVPARVAREKPCPFERSRLLSTLLERPGFKAQGVAS
jgi:adenylate cyclase